MYSKFITSNNWTSLSSVYIYDSNLSLNNEYFNGDGNLTATYSPFLKNLKDYSNNNYSLLFLSNFDKVQNKISFSTPQNTVATRAGLIAHNFINNLVNEDTVFFSLSSNSIGLSGILSFNNNYFIELLFIDSSRVIVYNFLNERYNVLTLDILEKAIKVLSFDKNPKELSSYERDKLSINYIFDSTTNNMVFYKNIPGGDLIIYKTFNTLLSSKISNPNNLDASEVFTLINVLDLPEIHVSSDFVSYKTNFDQNNLNIKKEKSLYNIRNNFLGHVEYNNIREDSLSLNLLTLKNQLNISDNQNRANNEDNNFRRYVTIHTGDNREEGYSNINLNYLSNKITYQFSPDKTTWFHLPFSDGVKVTNINNTSFFKNGAYAGSAPIYSDKIWKKLANYSNNATFRSSPTLENTGQWLCAWLSGGPENGIWVDRFYNNATFSPFDALNYNCNVNYTPQIKNLYEVGIKDYPSKLNLEPGSWYAYYHVGQKTAHDILKISKKDLIRDSFDIYKNNFDSTNEIVFDTEGSPVYRFDGKDYGLVYNVNNKSEYNNFTISFFATRKNWNVESAYSIFGNYLETGFGMFNGNKINLISHYVKDTTLYFLNNDFYKILTIDIKPFVFEQNENINIKDGIHSVFYRSLVENFFIVTKLGYIFEYTANGTLVDSLTTVNVLENNTVVSTSYNTNYGVILYSDGVVRRINFKDNTFIVIPEKDIVTVKENNNANIFNYTIIIDYANRVYLVQGKGPIFKNSNLYFINLSSNQVKVYNSLNGDTNTYINKNDTLSSIKAFSFNKSDETILIYHNAHEMYDVKGRLYETYYLKSSIPGLSSINFGYLNLGNEEVGVIQGISSNDNIYFYTTNYDSFELAEEKITYNIEGYKNLTFDNYYQSIIGSLFSIPGYNIKLKLNNIIDQEETIMLQTNILGEALDTGIHHFAFVLNTVDGFFNIYIDGNLYSSKNFTRGKYVFNNKLIAEDITFGTTPFYGGVTYNSFFKTDKNLLYVDDLILEKFKYYSKALTYDEVRLEYITKFNTGEIFIDIECGDRNYLDSISRVFKNSTPGKKSNLINIYVNDSLLKDKNLQDAYNNIIITEAKKYLPGHVKINKIIWTDSKKNLETMLEGFFNVENTLTNS